MAGASTSSLTCSLPGPWRRWFPLVLLALVALAYVPVFNAGYIWDDNDLLTDNQLIRSWSGLAVLWFDPTVRGRFYPDYYPMTYTSFALEYQLWGAHPLGYHLTNLVLHAINATLLWRLLEKLRVPGAWIVALVFALHPLQVQSVAWVSQRKTLLSGLLVFTSALLFVKYWLDEQATKQKIEGDASTHAHDAESPGRWRYALSLLCFGGAILSKPLTMTLAGILPVLIGWQRGRFTWRDARIVLPYFLMALPMAVLTSWLQYHHTKPFHAEITFSLLERWLIFGQVMWFYVGKMLWPWPLSFAYSRWDIDASNLVQHLSSVLVLVLLAMLWMLRKRIGFAPLVAALVYGILLSPSSGFFKVFWHRYYFVADHMSYLALIPVTALLVAILLHVTRNGPWATWVRGSIIALVLIPLATVTFNYSFVYRTHEGLWRDVLAKDPDSPAAHNSLGALAAIRGDDVAAEPLLRKALELKPRFFEAHMNMAKLEERRNQTDEALRHYRDALAIWPTSLDANLGAGELLARQGRFADALPLFENAVLGRPLSPQAHFKLGKLLYMLGDRLRALKHFQTARDLGLNDALLLRLLGELEASTTADSITHTAPALTR